MGEERAPQATMASTEGAAAVEPSLWRRFLDGLDERLGLKGLQYGVPEHANKLAYSLGGLSLFTFIVMVVTGIVLTQYYNPSPGRAHQSVHDIITSVTLGKFLRGLHYWGAMAMVVLVGLHLLRVFVSGSFKRPREGNWVIGVVLGATTAGLFFTGTVVKWDQESIEALDHNTEIAKLFGRFGFWFSPKFGGISLIGRLFVAHIAILPAFFTVVVIAHLLLVKYHGMAPSPFRRSAQPEHTEPFTRHLARLGAFAMVVLGVLALLAVLAPPRYGPTPVSGIEVTKPPWPMLWIYPVENLVGVSGILWATVAILGLLFIVPLLDRGTARDPRRRLPVIIGGAVVVATVIALILFAAFQPVASHVGGG